MKKYIEKYKSLSMMTKFFSSSLFVLFILIVICLSLCSCSKIWTNYPSDNIVEEIVEDIIESKTGLDIDLSPGSPEGK